MKVWLGILFTLAAIGVLTAVWTYLHQTSEDYDGLATFLMGIALTLLSSVAIGITYAIRSFL